MSKSIKKKSTTKKVSHSVMVDGKAIEIKTSCKKFSNPIINGKGEFVGNCKVCEKRGTQTFTACVTKFESNKPAPAKTGKGVGKYPPFIKVWANGKKRGAMKKAVEAMVEKDAYTKAEIVDAIRAAFPDARPTVPGMYIGHGMKGKGKDAKRFPFKIVLNDLGKISFNEKLPKGSWGQEGQEGQE